MHALHSGQSPYAGGAVHVFPLLLRGLARLVGAADVASLSALLFPVSGVAAAAPPARVVLLFVLADALAALCVFAAAHAVRRGCTDPRCLAVSRWFPVAAAALYALNPLSVVECVSMSLDVFAVALVLAALAAACWNLSLLAGLFMACASAFFMYPVLLVLPLGALLWRQPYRAGGPASTASRAVWTAVFVEVAAVGTLAAVLACTKLEGGDVSWVGEVYGFLYSAPDHTPSISLWWTLLTELFPHFTRLFVHALQLLLFVVYPVAGTLPLRRVPLVAVWLLATAWSVHATYPSLGHVALQITLHCLVVAAHLRTQRYRDHTLKVAGLMVLVAAVLVVLFADATRGWLYTGTGNVNFYYAAVLALQTAQLFWVSNTLDSVRREQFLEHIGHLDNGTQQQQQQQQHDKTD